MAIQLLSPPNPSRFRPMLRLSTIIIFVSVVSLYAFYFTRPSESFKKIEVNLEMPHLYLLGDSSMCKGGTNNGKKHLKYQGWGVYVKDYFNCNVTLHAISGRSSRMYTREGRFDRVLEIVKPGDYVVIQFGRNDKGTLKPRDNGKSVCPGPEREKTCESVFEGNKTTVLTFGGYIENAADAFKAKGVNVIIGSQTPNKPFIKKGKGKYGFASSPTEWVGYSEISAKRTNVTYVDHFHYALNAFKILGQAESEKLYPDPDDKSHTNNLGADFMARAFLKGLMCANSTLVQHMNQTAIQRVTGNCLSAENGWSDV